MRYLFMLVVLAGCQPPTPAQEVQILKAELAISNAKCVIYTLNPTKYPRDAFVTEKCDKLVKP